MAESRRATALKLVTLGVLVAWLLLREPGLLQFPRFWAEENAFASAATRLPWWESLFFVYRRAGYFSWPPSVGTTLGIHLLPLPYAPVFSTGLAFILQLTPALAVLWLRFPFPLSTAQRCIAAGVLTTSSAAGQGLAWLNVLGSQMHLGTLACVLLVASARQRTVAGSVAAIASLIAAGLSGAYAVFLLPVYAVAAIAERDPWRRRQTAALAVAFVVQAGVYGYGRLVLDLVNEKRGPGGWTAASLLTGLRETITIPMFGELAVLGGGAKATGFTALSLLLFAAALAVLVRSATRRAPKGFRDRAVAILCAQPMRPVWAFGAVVGAIAVFAFDGVPEHRYAIVPGARTMIVVLLALLETRSAGVRAVLACTALASIVAGVRDPRYPEAVRCDGATSGWREAAERWRGDAATTLPICPEGWTVKLYPVGQDSDPIPRP